MIAHYSASTILECPEAELLEGIRVNPFAVQVGLGLQAPLEFVDISQTQQRGTFYGYDPQRQTLVMVVNLGGTVGGFIYPPTSQRELNCRRYFFQDDTVLTIDLDAAPGEYQIIAQVTVPELLGARFNDIEVLSYRDTDMLVYAGSMPTSETNGVLWLLTLDYNGALLHIAKLAETGIPNGIAWRTKSDGTREGFFTNSTPLTVNAEPTVRTFAGGTINRLNIDAAGYILSSHVFARAPEGIEPDGLTLERETLFSCQWGGGSVRMLDVHTAQDVGRVSVPAISPTCAVVYDNSLYITTAARQDLHQPASLCQAVLAYHGG